MRIAFLGIRGVPARYSGFETAAEEVGRRLVARGHEVTVYCRGKREGGRVEYLGMRLVHLPTIRMKVTDTLVHTGLSVLHLLTRSTDAAIIFNAANAPLLPLLRIRRIPVAVHVDGLEWRRAKWGPTGKRYYLAAERLAVRWADALIADARGIQDYYQDSYGVPSSFIPYGAPIVRSAGHDLIDSLHLTPRGFHLIVARFEPENHVELMVRGFIASSSLLPLVVVGGAPYSARYTAEVEALAQTDRRVRLLGSVWDQDLLNQLYANAFSYLHGHSVGGTNPTLLRAMGASAPVVAFNVNFNREVLGDTGAFFNCASDLSQMITDSEAEPQATAARGARGQARALALYDWDAVTQGYEQLCKDMASG